MPKSGDTVCALFVGGPWDGRREEVRLSERIIVPVLDPPSFVKEIVLDVGPRAQIKQVVYRIHCYAGQKMTFVIYAEESLSIDEVIGLLWDGYAPSPAARPA